MTPSSVMEFYWLAYGYVSQGVESRSISGWLRLELVVHLVLVVE